MTPSWADCGPRWTPGGPVRVENLVHGSDQQSCSFGVPGVMISDHVPAVRVPRAYAGHCGVAAVQRVGGRCSVGAYSSESGRRAAGRLERVP